jgi:glutamate carboxypeptidase
MTELQKKIKEKAEEFAPKQLKVLEQLSGIDCGSRNVEGNAKVTDIIEGLLKEIDGIEVERRFFEGYGFNLVARLNKGNKNGTVVLNAHLDTVFKPGDAAAHPFHIEGDYAWGLGIVDCKGGVVQSIEAVKILQELDALPDKEILFIFNPDEEIGSYTGRQVFEAETPKNAELALVFEPSRGDNGIVIARKGSVSATIDVVGTAAHTGNNYLDGRSAVFELAHKALALYKLNDDERGIQFNVAELNSYGIPANVVTNHASARISVRVASQADIERVKEILAQVEKDDFYKDGTTTTITINHIGTPMEANETNMGLYEKIKAVGAELGLELPPQKVGGGSDASWFSAQGIPTADGLGPYMYDIHSTDEHLRISSIPERTWLTAAFLASLK